MAPRRQPQRRPALRCAGRHLRQSQRQRERTELEEVKVARTQEYLILQDFLRASNIRRAILDLKLAQLEIESAQITANSHQAQRLEPARQSAVRAIRRLHEAGPEAKDGVPSLVVRLTTRSPQRDSAT